MRRDVQTAVLPALRLRYLEQLRLGVHGNTGPVEADIGRAGIASPVGLTMMWEAELCRRAVGAARGAYDVPLHALTMAAWERAIGDTIAELRNAVGPTLTTAADDDGSTGGTPSPSSSASQPLAAVG